MPSAAGPDAAALAAWAEQRCVRGLGAAAGALAGDDPASVCRRLAAWKRGAGRRAWPWLPGLVWDALEPLAVAFPASDAEAVTLGRFLVGVETSPQRVRDALVATAQRPAPGAAPRVGDEDFERRRVLLEAALDRFWDEFAATVARLREPVLADDRASADGLLYASRRELEEHAHTVATHARRLAAPPTPAAPEAAPTPPRAAPRPPRPAASAQQPAAALGGAAPATAVGASVAQALEVTGALARDLDESAADGPAPVAVDWVRASDAAQEAGERWDVAGRAGPGAAADVPAGDVEYRTVRERRLAPVVFLAGVTLVALIWLLVIATGNG